jgi:hypothetical protein
LQTSQGYIIRILQHFATKLWNITNFVMLFQAVMKFLSRFVEFKISVNWGLVHSECADFFDRNKFSSWQTKQNTSKCWRKKLYPWKTTLRDWKGICLVVIFVILPQSISYCTCMYKLLSWFNPTKQIFGHELLIVSGLEMVDCQMPMAKSRLYFRNGRQKQIWTAK